MACINNEDLRKLGGLFDLYDTNSDGGINILELDIILRYFNQSYSMERLKKLFTDIDSDSNGEINFPEFLALMGIDSEVKSEDSEVEDDNNQSSIVEKSFKMFDTDSNGVISLNELDQLMLFLDQRQTKFELFATMSSVDGDNSGTIDLLEFQELLAKTADSHSPKLRQRFAQIDKDNNGFLSIAELYAELSSEGEQVDPLQATEVFNFADVNKDGWVDFEEFVKSTK